MIICVELVPGGMEYAGFLPMFLDLADPDPAAKQIDKNYQHGGGWNPRQTPKWRHLGDHVIQYPGDPPLKPLLSMVLRDEEVIVYQYGIVGIFQLDGSFEVARCD